MLRWGEDGSQMRVGFSRAIGVRLFLVHLKVGEVLVGRGKVGKHSGLWKI